jgi:hypothetical protein
VGDPEVAGVAARVASRQATHQPTGVGVQAQEASPILCLQDAAVARSLAVLVPVAAPAEIRQWPAEVPELLVTPALVVRFRRWIAEDKLLVLLDVALVDGVGGSEAEYPPRRRSAVTCQSCNRGPTTRFLEEVTHNRMTETLREAWFNDRGFEPSQSEVRSWRNSLKALANTVRHAGLLDNGILLECQLPMSSLRIDALITGPDVEGRAGAVIIELKQWDDALPSAVPECVGVMYGGKVRDVLHPSAQPGQYRLYGQDRTHMGIDSAILMGTWPPDS